MASALMVAADMLPTTRDAAYAESAIDRNPYKADEYTTAAMYGVE